MAPLFSIGVTTYDRVGMLKETLDSILAQSFGDYEVIISNDNPKREISGQSVGISDPRFKFVNQKNNLGELSNMNYLLRESTGKYFTWIADDDLYLPEFLESAHRVLLKYSFPKCVFTSFNIFKDEKPKLDHVAKEGDDQLFDGPEFFYCHAKGKVKTISTMGLFDRRAIQGIGGLEDMSGDGKGMFCEYMLLVKSITLDKVAYINRPLVLFRLHKGSWGGTSIDLSMYLRAVDNLIRQSIDIFKSPRFKRHFYTHLYFILHLAVLSIIGVMSRRASLGDRSVRKIAAYFVYSRRYINSLKKSRLYLIGLICLIHAEISIVLYLIACIISKRYKALINPK